MSETTQGARHPIAGGCQCGAVRYALSAAPRSTLCHCRMCQKAVGNLFAALALVKRSDIRWTRGAPTYFASSSVARRGFCAACGTPLSFEFNGRDILEITTGTLDDPGAFPIVEHFGVESRVAWVTMGPDLPHRRTDASADSPANAPGFVSYQQSSRDT